MEGSFYMRYYPWEITQRDQTYNVMYVRGLPLLNFDTLLRQSKLDSILNTLLTCFDTSVFNNLFTPFHTHFIRFRYDLLSSIIISYTFECIRVHLNCIKSESKIRCPILIGSKVYQSSARDD